MSLRLDDQLAALGSAEAMAPPDELEAAVWRRVRQFQEERSTARVLLRVQTGAVVIALGIGVVGGGLTAVAATGEPDDISVFSVHSALAPSTLLDRRR